MTKRDPETAREVRDQAPSLALPSAVLTPLAGMRDLLPPESRARRRVSAQLQQVFERYGYDLVTTPLFEHVEVFERGLTLDPRDLLRFVEPDGGEIAALRPDITPQIARVVATRLTELPPPFRLHYEGSVIRRRRGRARRQRQIAQVGVELIGISGVEADVEVIRLCAEACRAAGLEDFRIELSDIGVARALLTEHAPELPARAAEALARKDERSLARVLGDAGVPGPARDRIVALAHLHGSLDVLDEAERLVAGTSAAPHLASLREVARQLVALGLGPQLGVDLGEIRNFAYYNGVSFALLAQGPGEAIASGGRYDALLARYGAPQPATGVAIDVENLLSALDAAGFAWRERESLRFVVAAGPDAVALAGALHNAGIAAASLPSDSAADALAYARAWSYDAALARTESGELAALRAIDGAARTLSAPLRSIDIDALANWARSTQKE